MIKSGFENFAGPRGQRSTVPLSVVARSEPAHYRRVCAFYRKNPQDFKGMRADLQTWFHRRWHPSEATSIERVFRQNSSMEINELLEDLEFEAEVFRVLDPYYLDPARPDANPILIAAMNRNLEIVDDREISG